MKKRILIIGSLNMDMIIEMKRMPAIGETVLGDNLSYIPGGKGANQAYAAGRLGGDVAMLGCVGDDNMGEKLVCNIAGSGADASFIMKTENIPTGTAVIYVNEKGDNSIVVISGANNACNVEYLKQNDNLIQESDYVMVQMEIPLETIMYGIRRAKELNKTVILNPAPAPNPKTLPEDIFENIDYITPNETELIMLSGQTKISPENIREGARILLEKGVPNVLVTLGEKGTLYISRQMEALYPARKVEAVDTTAAGDCFNGAFVTALSEGKSVKEAVIFANCASSIAVTRKGAQSSIPDRKEVEDILKHWQQ
ncbi:ribokinase [Anaerocolumna xylanovorans]|uniref:Ribokinase n=1 Tax=Anaerocolumna xylanovorans DSM 12503 TaxID=1121345 RepID=A0A1M7Y2E8_9FIRM|nr:ribokinase [Anaerocolumna xylanovorans]SHO46074.1 ribokinase [Anaerocolumna xylanovorans DSM 12503]